MIDDTFTSIFVPDVAVDTLTICNASASPCVLVKRKSIFTLQDFFTNACANFRVKDESKVTKLLTLRTNAFAYFLILKKVCRASIDTFTNT